MVATVDGQEGRRPRVGLSGQLGVRNILGVMYNRHYLEVLGSQAGA